MRDFKGMKRQRGRNRGGGGGNPGGGKPQQNANRAFDSNGPDNIKVRGHAQHVFEKYQQLARDAASAGDRVLAENFLQHAEHYFRVLRTLQPNRPVADFMARDSFASGYDIDFEDESGAQAAPEEPASDAGEATGEGGDYAARDNRWEQRGERQQGDRQPGDRGQREDRPRYDRDQPRGERNLGERNGGDRSGGYRDRNGYRAEGGEGEGREERVRDDRPRDDRPREDRARDDRPREDRGYRDRPYRDDRARDDRPREDRYARDDRPPRSYEPRGDRPDPLAVVEPQAEPLTIASTEPITPPVRSRPARTTTETASEGAGVLRSSDGEISHAPAFLQAATPTAVPEGDEEAAPVKRGRGRPRKRPLEDATPQTEEA